MSFNKEDFENYRNYKEEIIALLKDGKSPEQIKRIIDNESTYEEVEAEIAEQKEAKRVAKQQQREQDRQQYLYNNQLMALIKSGKSPEEAIKILEDNSKDMGR